MRLTTDHYPTVLLTAVVAGVFSAVVCALLLADFARRSIALPLERPEFVAARAKLSEHPDDEALREQIRGLDLEFRREYFRRRQFDCIPHRLRKVLTPYSPGSGIPNFHLKVPFSSMFLLFACPLPGFQG